MESKSNSYNGPQVPTWPTPSPPLLLVSPSICPIIHFDPVPLAYFFFLEQAKNTLRYLNLLFLQLWKLSLKYPCGSFPCSFRSLIKHNPMVKAFLDCPTEDSSFSPSSVSNPVLPTPHLLFLPHFLLHNTWYRVSVCVCVCVCVCV